MKKLVIASGMTISIPYILSTEIKLPASKSISNRALIIRALAGGDAPLDNISDCDDSNVVVDALHAMPYEIDIKAAGTAMRFLTSVLATMPAEHVITGTERMCNRPIGVLVKALQSIGAEISYVDKEGFPPLRIKGRRLSGGHMCLPGNVSSQYISSLLLIAPTLYNGLSLELTGDIISRPYIDMTLGIMRQFGAKANWKTDNTIYVAPQPYKPTPYYIESDWSAASYWYEIVALSSDEELSIVLPGLFKKSLQGDSAVVRLFSSLGVETIFEDNQVCLRKTKNRIAEFVQDMVGQPDLAQTFVVTCCMLGIPFNIRGLKTLRIKETDRIAALQGELLKLGYVIHAGSDDSLSWNGEKMSEIPDLDSVGIDTYDDHRMAMAFAPVALTRGTIVINNPEVVSKSYPNFWQDLKKCGFKLD